MDGTAAFAGAPTGVGKALSATSFLLSHQNANPNLRAGSGTVPKHNMPRYRVWFRF
jgi:Rad3-related DNA helicase